MTDKVDNSFTAPSEPIRRKSNKEKSFSHYFTVREGKTLHLSRGLVQDFGIKYLDTFEPTVDYKEKLIRLRSCTGEYKNMELVLIAVKAGGQAKNAPTRLYFYCKGLIDQLKIPNQTHKLPAQIVQPEKEQAVIQFRYITKED